MTVGVTMVDPSASFQRAPMLRVACSSSIDPETVCRDCTSRDARLNLVPTRSPEGSSQVGSHASDSELNSWNLSTVTAVP